MSEKAGIKKKIKTVEWKIQEEGNGKCRKKLGRTMVYLTSLADRLSASKTICFFFFSRPRLHAFFIKKKEAERTAYTTHLYDLGRSHSAGTKLHRSG
jgi:uncharacterized C2H2 Zn-finger protein